MANILFTGANGKISSGAIAALHGKGHKLVALVRDPAKGTQLAAQGVELRVGDLDKLRTIEPLFDNIDVAFVLSPPGGNAPLQSSNAVWAARQAGVKHIVRMSAIGAAHTAPSLNGRMHALSDAELAASGTAFTILKPHFFTQNLLMGAQTVQEQGTLYFALGDAKLPMIDTRDVSEVVATIVANPAPYAGKTLTLTGPEAVSLHQFAAAIGEATGKPVKYQPVPIPSMIEQFAKFGVDDFGQTAMRDYFTAYSSGWQSAVTSSVKDVLGREARGIHEFARDHAAAFKK